MFLIVRRLDQSMLPTVFDPCKRHSSKERANFRRHAALSAVQGACAGTTFDFWGAK
jgi:hypothetical protein